MATDALITDLPSDLLDVVAGIDRAMSSMSALRARAIETALLWITDTESSRPSTRGPSADAELARRLLVAELAPLLRITGSAAAHLVGESRSLVRDLPATLDALAAGDITYRHACIVIDNAASLPDQSQAAFEAAVLPAALRLNAPRFADHARRTRERHHPASLAIRRRAAHDRRNVGVEPARDGMAWLSLYGPADKIVAIDDRLDRVAASIRSTDDPRTFAQLRADAFCDLLINGEAPGTLPTGIRPQILVTIPALTLLRLDDEPATLEGYGPIPADLARELAAEAPSFVRLLTHPETGAVLSVGRARYSVPADMRLFLRARDETCRGIGCGRRAATSDIDHGRAWANGGTTSVDNLAHLCRGDHTRKHALGWRMSHLPGGTIRWTSPFGRTYLTEPSTVIRT
ncbi:MAG: DUF222 domain-containing protein [Pseudolysinimonas sp.]